MIIVRMILPPVKSPLVESIVRKIFPDPVSKHSALGRLSLISFWILMGLVPFSVLLVNRPPGKVWVAPKAAESCTPKSAFLTNVHSRGFSISWITTGTCRGFLTWDLSPTGAGTNRGDDRTVDSAHPNGDLNWTSSAGTHHVTIPLTTRPAEGKAYLKLYSGDKNYEGTLDQLVPEDPANPRRIVIHLPADPAHNPAQLASPTNTPGAYSTEKDAFSECPNGKTASSCSGANERICAADSTLCCNKACFRPYPIWGEVKDNRGNPVEGALVFALIPTNTSGMSSKLSTLTNNQGRWTLELANLHKTVIGGNASDGSNISAEFFAYNTDRDANGQTREPDKIVVGAGAPKVGSNLDNPTQASLHSVIDSQTCSTRNSCTSHACTMENPSPICITLGETSASPTCTSLTLDKTQAAPEDPVKVGVIAKSGSSNFKTTSAITLVALRVSDNSTHGILTFFRCDGVDAKTTPCTDTTQGFTPAHAQIPQAGLYKFYVTMVNQEGKTCDDSPTSPTAQKCGCSAKELTVTAADAPQISEVRPNRGLRGTEVNVTVTGTKLHPSVTYKLARGETKIDGAINATPAPSATAVSVKFNIPASAVTGNWNLVATKGTSTASYPFIIVDSTEATVVTFFVELQGLDKSTSPRRQLKVNVSGQDYVVESLPQAQARYVGAFVLPSSVTGLKEFKVWEPEVRLKRKFSGTVTSGDINYYDWTGKKILAGDFDGNNKITLADFTGPQGILKPLQTGNKISLPITEALKKYDINGDNALNVLDISLVLLNFSGLEVPGE